MNLSDFCKIENPEKLKITSYRKVGNSTYLQMEEIEESGIALYDGKVICTKAEAGNEYFTSGKIYEAKQGRFLDDKGLSVPSTDNPPATNFEDLVKPAAIFAEFIEL